MILRLVTLLWLAAAPTEAVLAADPMGAVREAMEDGAPYGALTDGMLVGAIAGAVTALTKFAGDWKDGGLPTGQYAGIVLVWAIGGLVVIGFPLSLIWK